MNDRSELAYAYDLVDSVLNQIPLENAGVRRRTFFTAAQDAFSRIRDAVDAYAFCLCESGDSVALWREYSARGTGYSLGLESSKLRVAEEESLPLTFELGKVVYDPKVQRKHVSDAIHLALRAYLENGNADEKGSLSTALTSLAIELMYLTVLFKNPVFSVEDEWRLVSHMAFAPVRPKYRAGVTGITPYVEIPLIDSMDLLPLIDIIQGPQVAPDIGRRALRARAGTTATGVA